MALKNSEAIEPFWRLLMPRYWAIWAGIGIVRVIVLLPFAVQGAMGRGLGRVAWHLARRERRIGAVNLALCLPELTALERERLLRRHFEALGCGLFDTALCWWGRSQRIMRLTHVEGFQHLEAALASGKGAIVLSAHFTATEMGVRTLAVRLPVAAMYQQMGNALADAQIRASGRRSGVRMIRSDAVRELLHALKDNLPVWFAPDQREQMRSSSIVPFFGIPAVTNTATSRLALISSAAVLPLFTERSKDGYTIRIGPPIAGFPSADAQADAQRFHELLEAQVRRCPAQYLWTYKRFKRPGPGGDPYARAAKA